MEKAGVKQISDIIRIVDEFWQDFCPVTLTGKKIMPLHEFYVYMNIHEYDSMEGLLTDLLSFKNASKIRNGKLRFLLVAAKITNKIAEG